MIPATNMLSPISRTIRIATTCVLLTSLSLSETPLPLLITGSIAHSLLRGLAAQISVPQGVSSSPECVSCGPSQPDAPQLSPPLKIGRRDAGKGAGMRAAAGHLRDRGVALGVDAFDFEPAVGKGAGPHAGNGDGGVRTAGGLLAVAAGVCVVRVAQVAQPIEVLNDKPGKGRNSRASPVRLSGRRDSLHRPAARQFVFARARLRRPADATFFQ
jgi:hypothetical protein